MCLTEPIIFIFFILLNLSIFVAIGPINFINKCKEKNIAIPKMLEILINSENNSFYMDGKYLTKEGIYKDI